jgi:hypothetical protein
VQEKTANIPVMRKNLNNKNIFRMMILLQTRLPAASRVPERPEISKIIITPL